MIRHHFFRALIALGLIVGGVLRISGQQTVYHYDGDTTPNVGTYGNWFTTLGPGHPTGTYFLDTTWASDGDVLTFNTVYPNQGIWFGRTSAYGDPSVGFDLAGTGDGNIVTMRAALGTASSEWSLYWYDANGYGSSFYLLADSFRYSYYDTTTSMTVTNTYVVADMTAFHTYQSYVLGGQVSYFFDDTYLGGGGALPNGPANFLLVGDSSANDHSGTGSFLLDSLTVTTAALSYPAAVPEPAAAAGLMGMVVLAMGVGRRGRR